MRGPNQASIRLAAVLISLIASARSGQAGEQTTDSAPASPSTESPPPPPPRRLAPRPEPRPHAAEAKDADSGPKVTDSAPILSSEPVDSRVQVDGMLGLGSEHLNLGLGARGGSCAVPGSLFVRSHGT